MEDCIKQYDELLDCSGNILKQPNEYLKKLDDVSKTTKIKWYQIIQRERLQKKKSMK